MSEMSRELDFEHTEAIIKGFTHLANFVILDLPGWPSAVTAAAARLSQFVGLVTAREPLAVRCGQSAVAQLKAWGISGGLVGAIIVGQSNLPLAMELSDIQSQLGCGILRIVPPSPAACSKANKDGVPLVLSQPDNEAAEAYIDIAKLLVDHRGVKMDV
jgi:MinD-like ATPase involved in chromosome partitioning or flagellar assembly